MLGGGFGLLGAVGSVQAGDELVFQGKALGQAFGKAVDPGGEAR